MTAIAVGSLSQFVPLAGQVFEAAPRLIVNGKFRVPHAFRFARSIPTGGLFGVYFALDPPSLFDESREASSLGQQVTAVLLEARLRLE
jgi:hypothetical protein